MVCSDDELSMMWWHLQGAERGRELSGMGLGFIHPFNWDGGHRNIFCFVLLFLWSLDPVRR